MDYDPNPAAYIPPPIERPHYYAPPMAHRHPSPPPHYIAPLRSHIPRDPSLSHYSAPPPRTSPPPYTAAPPEHTNTTPYTVLSGYSDPPLVKNPPLTDLPHYVAPEAHHSDTNVVLEWTSSQSYVFSSAYYANPTSHHSQGYEPYSDPYVLHSTHHQGSAYSVTGHSYQSAAYQSGGYHRYEYPQVTSGARTQYPQYPPAKAGLGLRTRVPHRKQKRPKPITTVHYCQICEVSCSTARDLGIHRQGKKHERNMEKLQGAVTPMIGPQPQGADDLPKSPSQLAERKRKDMATVPASLEELEEKKKRVFDAGAPVEGVRVCGVCNIVVNSQKVFDLHCAGSKHAMMLKRLQEGL